MLVDSLWFVTLSALRRGLDASLNHLLETDQIVTPAVVLPERALDDFDIERQHRDSPVGYHHFHPGSDVSVTAGSEGLVGAVLRDFPGIRRPRREAPWIPPQAGLEELRARRCRSIVIVTDYVGSGDQLLKLAAAIARNPTIRSWRSFGWLRIHAVAYAGNPHGLARLRADPMIAGVWTADAAPTFETVAWRREVREAVVALCQTECRINQRWALGYHDSASLFVSERGASNNLPAVFWQTAPDWHALFPERTVPAEFARRVDKDRRAEPLPCLAERVGQLRIGRNERLQNLRSTSRSLLAVLLLPAERRRDASTLAATMAIDVSYAEALRECLLGVGLIDATGRITDRGRDEIAANKRGLRHTTARLEGSDAPYYPHGLR